MATLMKLPHSQPAVTTYPYCGYVESPLLYKRDHPEYASHMIKPLLECSNVLHVKLPDYETEICQKTERQRAMQKMKGDGRRNPAFVPVMQCITWYCFEWKRSTRVGAGDYGTHPTNSPNFLQSNGEKRQIHIVPSWRFNQWTERMRNNAIAPSRMTQQQQLQHHRQKTNQTHCSLNGSSSLSVGPSRVSRVRSCSGHRRVRVKILAYIRPHHTHHQKHLHKRDTQTHIILHFTYNESGPLASSKIIQFIDRLWSFSSLSLCVFGNTQFSQRSFWVGASLGKRDLF